MYDEPGLIMVGSFNGSIDIVKNLLTLFAPYLLTVVALTFNRFFLTIIEPKYALVFAPVCNTSFAEIEYVRVAILND